VYLYLPEGTQHELKGVPVVTYYDVLYPVKTVEYLPMNVLTTSLNDMAHVVAFHIEVKPNDLQLSSVRTSAMVTCPILLNELLYSLDSSPVVVVHCATVWKISAHANLEWQPQPMSLDSK
jgi:hypothetical protein